MIDLDHAARQLGAVWALTFPREGDDWRDRMDRSMEATFRSFWALLIAAPFSFMVIIAVRRAAAASPDIESSALMTAPLIFHLFTELLVYLVDWGVSIAAIVIVARVIEAARHASDAIIAYNWAQVFAAALQSAPLAIIGVFGSAEIAGILAIPALVISLMILWSVFRRALTASAGMAVAMIAIMVLITIVVGAFIRGAATGLLQVLS